jgi:hypothetical protein
MMHEAAKDRRGLRPVCCLAAAAVLAASLVLACRKSSPGPVSAEAADYFVDVTAASGVDFTYRNGQEADHFSILETVGGGVALLDYDRDGLLDVFVTGGGYFGGPDRKQIAGHPSRLYRNLGNWRFQDVTREAGLDGPLFYTHGCAVADYDNDGWPDLLVTGWGRLALYHNEPDGKGGRRFVEVTHRAGLTDTLWSTSAAWGDLNGDGFPDLYVCHYVNWSFANDPFCKDYQNGERRDVCSPRVFNGLPHTLYRNNGDGTFRDTSRKAGLRPDGKGLGVLIADLDDDGRPDVYVANDTSGNFLYLNRGHGRLEEVATDAGVALADNGAPTGSMGVDAADYDGSGRLSLFVTNYQHEAHALYRNRGGGQFTYGSHNAGISALGLIYVGFGTGFLDFDRDGAEDLFISNGHVVRYPPPPREVQQVPLLLRNTRTPGTPPHRVRFEDVSARAGPFFQARHTGRGVAFGDLDNDGRTDIVISHLNEPVVLLRNNVDNGHHWLGVELIGKPCRDLVGAKLVLEVGGRRLVRTVKGGGSYLSSSDRRVVFGLGDEPRSGRLTVRWPSGKIESRDDLAVDRYWQLEEGQR